MSIKQSSAYCHVCQRQTLFQKPKLNHVLHLILTILTVGVWGLVWLVLAIAHAAKPDRCVTCGTAKGHGAIAPPMSPNPEALETRANTPEH